MTNRTLRRDWLLFSEPSQRKPRSPDASNTTLRSAAAAAPTSTEGRMPPRLFRTTLVSMWFNRLQDFSVRFWFATTAKESWTKRTRFTRLSSPFRRFFLWIWRDALTSFIKRRMWKITNASFVPISASKRVCARMGYPRPSSCRSNGSAAPARRFSTRFASPSTGSACSHIYQTKQSEAMRWIFFFDFIISGCALFWLSVSFWLMSLRPVAILIQVFFIDYPTEFHPWKVNKTQFSTQIVIFENQSLGSQISAFQKTKLKYGIRDWHSKPISKKTHEMD